MSVLRGPLATASSLAIVVTAVIGSAAAVVALRPDPSSATGATRLVVVQRRIVAVADRPDGTAGPRRIVVGLGRPTRRGDLLVAGVDDGVETSGMAHPRYLFPGWRRAATTIGGQTAQGGPPRTGGLEAGIFYFADNPGGITDVDVAAIPRGTRAWVSVVLVELSGAPARLPVDTTGVSTSGPTPKDYSNVSTVRASRPTSHAGDIVFTVFDNGGDPAHEVAFSNTPGWKVLGEVNDVHDDGQPICLDVRVEVHRAVVVWQRDRFTGAPIDSCAVIAALG